MEIENKVVAFSKQNQNSEAFTLLKSEATPQADKVQATIDSLIALKTSTGNQLSANLSSQATASRWIILAVILISLITSISIALTIAHSISKPVKEMAEAAQRMASGDLNVQINVDSKNEIGQLGEAFAKSAASIKAYIADITKNLGKVEHGDLTVVSDLDYIGDYVDLKDSFWHS